MTTIELERPGTPPRLPSPPPTPDSPLDAHRRRPNPGAIITTLIGLLAALLYTWDLSIDGMANSYYAAAVKAGTVSWKAFFFGSIDPGSFITVDKPPAALWVMELSGRIFGFSSWSMLLPEAIAGVASVLLLHRLVRKWAGDTAAHLAALALTVTPVAALMFRFNNPDALLTLLSLAAASTLWKAVETGRTRWLVATGALLGFAFETKMLQAFLVLPAMALVYLWAGPPKLGRRLAQLFAAGIALLVAGGWWVAIVALWPASSRPYIGSTSDNSILSLVFGYNGLARIFGSGGGGGGGARAGTGGGAGRGGGGGGGANFGGTPGLWRLFNSEIGGYIAWLIPLAAAGLIAGLWLTRRSARTDRGRAGWLLWGGWFAVAAATFSLSKGTFHPYYTVQLAPAVAALAAAGAVAMWHIGRRSAWASWILPAAVLVTGGVSVDLLDRTPSFHPWLRTAIAVGAVTGAVGLFAATHLRRKILLAVAAAVAAVTLLAGPTAYTLATIGHSATGSTPAVGPATSGLTGGPGGQGSGTASDQALVEYLEAHRDGAEYLVAGFSSNATESIIIDSGQAVITVGGFSGTDPAPTLAQFERLVALGKVRYVIVSSSNGGGPGGGTTSAISEWVTSHGTQVSYGGSSGTLYRV